MNGNAQSLPSGVPDGDELPRVAVRPPGPRSRQWLARAAAATAPMGPPEPAKPIPELITTGIVYARGVGANVIDVDGNRFVDLAGGFGALLLGHSHQAVVSAVRRQSEQLLHALGDLHPSDCKVLLSEALAGLIPTHGARTILGQSGADAITAALKSASLCSGRPGWVACGASYHGLGYAPLALCGLRSGYVAPFRAQLNPHAQRVAYPSVTGEERSLNELERALRSGTIGAVVIEPILGRGGIIPVAPGALSRVRELTREHGALLIVDEIWTGLGRSGEWLYSGAECCDADIVCFGKGLGGGLPISACVGKPDVMQHWQQPEEVVHTSTFAGAPLACATALATLEALRQEGLVRRSAILGTRWLASLRSRLAGMPAVKEIRGRGMMVGIELNLGAGGAVAAMSAMLDRGFIVTTGGGKREVVVLTPPLTIAEPLLEAFIAELADWLQNRQP